MTIKQRLQHKYALSEQGAKDMIGAIVCITLSNLVLMFPVGVLYYLVRDYLNGSLTGRGSFYIIASAICLLLIAVTTYRQYNATFLATYVESGVRRITLAEQLRKIPLSFFGKKDLSDLTSTIMGDCSGFEHAFSHTVPQFWGSLLSTALVCIALLVYDWRMGLALLWVAPAAFAIVLLSRKLQERQGQKHMAAKVLWRTWQQDFTM